MQVIIHRGTHQIGGCVTEIKSEKGTRIAIDIGENLPTISENEKTEMEVEGLTKGKANFDAVFVTHYHGDHIGLYNRILPQIPIYVSEVSKEVYKILQERLEKAGISTKNDLTLINDFKTYKIPEKIKIKDILITPIEVDHSAFSAHMFLLECDGKKLLHTGDFRIHGQRGKSVIPALEKYVGKVDCLICEGTTLSRKKEQPMTEFELQKKAEQIFKENKYNFVMCSSTNIDRIAAIHQATSNVRKLFICDNFQKEILDYISTISRSNLYKFYNNVYSYGQNLLTYMQEKGFVMLVRDNKLSRIIMNKFPNSKFIYSQWEGYLNERFTEYKHLQEFVPKNYICLHTSGHADFNAIKQVCETVKAKEILPIHGENPEAFKEMNLKDCVIKIVNNNEEIKI